MRLLEEPQKGYAVLQTQIDEQLLKSVVVKALESEDIKNANVLVSCSWRFLLWTHELVATLNNPANNMVRTSKSIEHK